MELRASRIPGVVSLAQGIPNFDTPAPIRDYVREKIASGDTSRYSLTPGLPKLRELISEALVRDGMRYDPDGEIVVTCGAIEAISATLLAVLEPGDEVILPSPSYASYVEAIRIARGVPKFVPLLEEENFALDPGAIEAAIGRRTKVILYSNPNNPTGTIYTRPQIERLAALALSHGLLLLSDEVYKDFLYADVELVTPAQLPDLRRQVVRVFSFSKAYGMTGWRVGFLHSDRANVAEILKVHDALVTCAPVVSQYAAIAALELGDEVVDGFRAEFRQRRDRTLAHLDALSDVFDYQKPNASYFVFPRVKDWVPLARDSRRLALDVLERAHVALVPGVAFGPTGEAHLRISYSRRSEEIEEAFTRLKLYFDEVRGGDVVRRLPAPPGEAPRVPAPAPTLRDRGRRAAVPWLGFLARLYLGRVRPRVVGIAGLQGKTVVKRWLREILGAGFRVRANLRSYNTEIGLPLAVLDVPIESGRVRDAAAAVGRATLQGFLGNEDLDVLILEMGLRQAGDARQLLRTVVPDVLVVTPVAPSFPNDLAFLETIEAEVAVLARAVAERGGTVVACGDDPRVVDAVRGLERVRTFRREQVEETDGRLRLALGDERLEVGREAVGESSRYALLAGVEVARVLDMRPDRLRVALG